MSGEEAGVGEAVGEALRGGVHLYVAMMLNTVGGFAYWMALSALAGPGLLGAASAVVGLASMLAGLSALGVGLGVRRFIGACRGDPPCYSAYISSTAALAAVDYAVVSAALLASAVAGPGFPGYPREMAAAAAGLTAAVGVGVVYQSFLVSLVMGRELVWASLAANAVRLAAGVPLAVWAGLGWLGAAAGYALFYAAQAAIGAALLAPRLAPAPPRLSTVVEVVKAGLASWVPGIIATAGQWLGVVAVFGESGAVETGRFYVAQMVFMAVTGAAVSIVSVMLPVVSGMRTGREEAAARSVAVSLALTTPLAAYATLYPREVLSVVGEEYAPAAPALALLLSAAPSYILALGTMNLEYARGRYGRVAGIGVAMNAPRILLYYLLVPEYHGLGAAAAYAAGTAAGLAYAAASEPRSLPPPRRALPAILAPWALLAAIKALGAGPLAGAAAALALYPAFIAARVIEPGEALLLARALAALAPTRRG